VLQTWVPDLKRREDLLFDFTFQAPSGRTFKSRACPCDGHSFECKFSPDEMGLWAYLWRARPDKRFREQRGSGHFTVVRAQVPSHYQALRAFAATALDDARSGGGHLAHRRSVHRLTALGREARSFLSAELARGAPGGSIKDLESLLEELAKGIPRAK
jgi:hypothetical protein